MTVLRQRMLDDMRIRNYSANTQNYLDGRQTPLELHSHEALQDG
jgi:hypothetical protein